MPEAHWDRHADQHSIRLVGVAHPEVRPASAFPDAPPMAGSLVVGEATWFVPRFGFVPGTAYTVTSDGHVVATLVCPRPDQPATTEVVAIHPASDVVPRNLLRCYVTFSAPMSEGHASRVQLVDDAGQPLVAALLPLEYELWDTEHRRLTVLLDPARIKRGLAGHDEIGYPLRIGDRVRLVVEKDFLDAQGLPLKHDAEREFIVGPDLRGLVDPRRWELTPPGVGTTEPLTVTFDRPLDHGLVSRCLTVPGMTGTAELNEPHWRFTPDQPWQTGHTLRVDPVLEDVAGNSISHVFDRDLADPTDEPTNGQPVELPFL